MGGKKRKINMTSRYLLLLALFSILVNIFLGVLLTRQSANSIRSLMRSRMLDISRTAASLIDGDKLRSLSPEDAGTESYEAIMKVLSGFKDNIELSYIYCVRDMGDGSFTFTLDPSVDPGVFGSPVVYTDALYQASRGKDAVDLVPYTDAWGTFYKCIQPGV
ncbi:MAG: hypothetical protein K5696_03975 [Lachnospiraceae bacterium]|nr:hypothetical protein [Lachnospiraceae bacterium]